MKYITTKEKLIKAVLLRFKLKQLIAKLDRIIFDLELTRKAECMVKVVTVDREFVGNAVDRLSSFLDDVG